MRVSVIGCGYLGAVHAASMAELGHDVIGIDVDQRKVDALSQGVAPFFEPEFDEMLRRNVEAGRLTFSTDFSRIAGAQVHFIGVGTPQSDSGAADMTYVYGALEAIHPYLGQCSTGREIVAGKSTVPVGTAAQVASQIDQDNVTVVWNPEFLREGFAVQDTLRPDRMVYGLPEDESAAAQATQVLDTLYERILESGTPRLLMDYATAELVKVAANSFLATKISFINAVAEVCDTTGADVNQLAKAIGLDDRIGKKFLRAGIGFGGGCLPKDIRAFSARSTELGATSIAELLTTVDTINNSMIEYVLRTLQESQVGSITQKRVAILGAAFKPNSDDTRNSPAIKLAERLLEEQAQITIHDPKALNNVPDQVRSSAVIEPDLSKAIAGADVIVIATEWDIYRTLTPTFVRKTAGTTPVIVDARNTLDGSLWTSHGFNYKGIGRGARRKMAGRTK